MSTHGLYPCDSAPDGPRPTHVLPTSSPHPAHVQPMSWPRPARVQPASSPRPACVQPASSLRPTHVLPASSLRPAHVQPTSSPCPACVPLPSWLILTRRGQSLRWARAAPGRALNQGTRTTLCRGERPRGLPCSTPPPRNPRPPGGHYPALTDHSTLLP